jgi:hypothetical protein
MILKEFIETFVLPNTLIRLWEPTQEGHRIITEAPVMEWELLQEKTVYSLLLYNIVIGVTDILINDVYPETVNIVLHNTVDWNKCEESKHDDSQESKELHLKSN